MGLYILQVYIELMFSRRNFAGAILFLLLVGELTVGGKNGLFTPRGFIVLLLLYWTYFMLFDALVAHYRLTYLGIILINFALYSVLITGLLHGELADFVTKPQNDLITTLIRIQCSLFPIFVYRLLGAPKTTDLRRSALIFIGFVTVVSLFSPTFGWRRLMVTFEFAPFISLGFFLMAVLAWWLAANRSNRASVYKDRRLFFASLILLAVSLIPSVLSFLMLLILMISFALILLSRPNFRQAAPA
jgi:hypothetical protein